MAQARAKHDTAIQQQNAAIIQASMWVAWAKQQAVKRASMQAFANTDTDSLSIIASSVERELKAAVEIIRTMPETEVVKLGYGSSWPEVVRQFHESYDTKGKIRGLRIIPSQEDIDTAMRVVGWLNAKDKTGKAVLTQREQRIIMARVSGLSLRDLGRLYRVSHESIQREYRVGLIVIGLIVCNGG